MQQEQKYIYEVYRSGSFSKAAQKLYLTQPALSISVKKVEKELGVMLFDRSCQPLCLTEAGEVYLRKLHELKQLEDDLANELQDLALLNGGKLRLAGTQYFNSYAIPEVIKAFSSLYPNVKLSLLEDNSGLLNEKLTDGSADICFHCGPFDTAAFQGIEVFRDYLLLAVPEIYISKPEILSQGLTSASIQQNHFRDIEYAPVPLTAFADVPFLLLSESNNLRQRSLSICQSAGLTANVRFYVEQLSTAWHMTSHGLGATFVSDAIIRDAQPPAGILYYRLNAPEATRHFHAVMRRHTYISHSMQAFIDLARQINSLTVEKFPF